jgi:hypothetical protein
MTVLRFGTETGRVATYEKPRFASAEGGFSQRVTPVSSLEMPALARVFSGR